MVERTSSPKKSSLKMCNNEEHADDCSCEECEHERAEIEQQKSEALRDFNKGLFPKEER